MKRLSVLVPALLLIVVALAAVDSVYVVDQTQQAVVLQFSRPVAVINAGSHADGAGLHVKWPFVDQVVRLDRRVLPLQSDPIDIVTADQDQLKVQADMSYRILDPMRFYQAVGSAAAAPTRLQILVETGLRQALAGAKLQDIVADRRQALMQSALADTRRQASVQKLGVKIIDVRLLDASPSEIDAVAITRRMQDRETQQAATIRAQGEEHKRELLAQADRDAVDVHADADRQALDIRGDGDAQRAAILGAAYGKDADFARFFRRLEAYDQALNPDNTTLVLTSDNAFLSLFGHGPAGAAPGH